MDVPQSDNCCFTTLKNAERKEAGACCKRWKQSPPAHIYWVFYFNVNRIFFKIACGIQTKSTYWDGILEELYITYAGNQYACLTNEQNLTNQLFN